MGLQYVKFSSIQKTSYDSQTLHRDFGHSSMHPDNSLCLQSVSVNSPHGARIFLLDMKRAQNIRLGDTLEWQSRGQKGVRPYPPPWVDEIQL